MVTEEDLMMFADRAFPMDATEQLLWANGMDLTRVVRRFWQLGACAMSSDYRHWAAILTDLATATVVRLDTHREQRRGH